MTTNTKFNPRYTYSQLAASTAAIKTGPGTLRSIFVSSASTGTLAVYDNTAGSGTKIVDTFSVAAGVSYPFDAFFKTGLSVVVGGTVSYTVLYQ